MVEDNIKLNIHNVQYIILSDIDLMNNVFLMKYSCDSSVGHIRNHGIRTTRMYLSFKSYLGFFKVPPLVYVN